MADSHDDRQGHPRRMSRRELLKLLAAAGLLAGCRPLEEAVSPTPMPPTPTPGPTARPTAAMNPTKTPKPTPTPLPTVDQAATPVVRRPGIVRFYPDVPSRVVRARHPAVWSGEDLVSEAIGQMLDASILALTGLASVNEAWSALFDPGERIAIKVNTIAGSSGFTHVPLVNAVTDRLQAIGVPAEQIVVWDRDRYELRHAGFILNEDGPGVRCLATGSAHTDGWKIGRTAVRLSNILLGCDALINMPILKQHMYAGISFAMKNHYGTINVPELFHGNTSQAIPALNAIPEIRDRTRLIIGDALLVVLGDNWERAVRGDSIFVSYDPVAHDAVALPLWSEVRTANGGNPAAYIQKANGWLENAAILGLGTNDPRYIDRVEVELG